MAFSSIIRRSVTRAAPLAARFVGSQRNIHSAASSTAVSALKRATLTSRFIPAAAAGSSAGRRFCSTDALTAEKPFSDKNLLEVVQTEIDVAIESEELEKAVEIPADFPFEIEDNSGEQTVTLSREYDGETITVEVSMPNLVTGEEDEGPEEDDDEDGEPRSDSSVPLLVTVTKKDGNGPFLEFDCTGFPDEIRINSLSLRNPASEDTLAYEGPDFLDLDENLQKAFHKYLEIRGIKPSATNLLHEYMIQKDNKEYVQWLNDIKNFVKA